MTNTIDVSPPQTGRMVLLDDERGGGDAVAHLLRRAGYGGSPAEIERAARRGFEVTVDDLLHPPAPEPDESLVVERYFPASAASHEAAMSWPLWTWPVLTSPHPLREKMALFWHGLFATGFKVGMYGGDQLRQIEMFRRHGLDRFDRILHLVAQSPAMIVWLDNQTNTAAAPNENFGRELLELFTMGAGHYSETDIKAAASAFAGWTTRPPLPAFVLGPEPLAFEYDASRHESRPRQFLEQATDGSGPGVVEAICRHEATASFVCSRLYRFFVADEVDPAALAELVGVYVKSGGCIRSILRTLFLAPWFGAPVVRGGLVKSPIEMVFGLARTSYPWPLPSIRMMHLVEAAGLMGQTPLGPPNVGGWPKGAGWLHGSAMLTRVNFAAATVADPDATELRRHLDASVPAASDADGWLTSVLLLLGFEVLSAQTYDTLAAEARSMWSAARPDPVRLATLAVAAPEFQYC